MVKYIILLIIVLFTTNLICQRLDTSVYDKYRIRELKYITPQLTVDLHHYNTSTDEENSNIYNLDRQHDNESSQVQFDFLYKVYHESEQKISTFSIRPSVVVLKNRNNYAYNDTTLFDNYRSKTYTGNIYVEKNISSYFNQTPWFSGVNVNLSNYFYQNESESDDDNPTYYRKNTDKQYEQSYNLNLNGGYGRLRDVTSVHKALMMERRMQELKVIESELNPEEIILIAQALESNKKYSLLNYRSQKEHWRHVETVLDSMDISLDDLDFWSTSYLMEVTDLIHFNRFTGSKWEIGIIFDYNNYYDRYQYYYTPDTLTSSSENRNESLYLKINPKYDWFQQLSFRSQISLHFDLSGGCAISHDPTINQLYSSNFRLRYQRDVTDKLLFDNDLAFDYDRYNASTDMVWTNWILSAGLNYYILDTVSIKTQYSYKIYETKYDNVVNPPDRASQSHRITIKLVIGPRAPSNIY